MRMTTTKSLILIKFLLRWVALQANNYMSALRVIFCFPMVSCSIIFSYWRNILLVPVCLFVSSSRSLCGGLCLFRFTVCSPFYGRGCCLSVCVWCLSTFLTCFMSRSVPYMCACFLFSFLSFSSIKLSSIILTVSIYYYILSGFDCRSDCSSCCRCSCFYCSCLWLFISWYDT